MSTGKHWVTEPHQILEPKISKSGFGSRPPKTVIQVFTDAVTKHGGEKAMAQKKIINVRQKILHIHYLMVLNLRVKSHQTGHSGLGRNTMTIVASLPRPF